MTGSLLFAWWNLIYVVPFGLAAAYLGIYVFTGITFGDHDVDADLDADADLHTGELGGSEVHVEAHVVADGDADMDADADVDADADAPDAPMLASGAGSALVHAVHVADAHVHSAAARRSPFFAFLGFLGVGKIPLSLVCMILLLLWGAIGFLLNQVLGQFVPQWLVGAISPPVTGLISVVLTSLIARGVGHVLPSMETYARRRRELVGQTGEALYAIDATFGMVSVRDRDGDLFQVPCRTADDAPAIAKGTRVAV